MQAGLPLPVPRTVVMMIQMIEWKYYILLSRQRRAWETRNGLTKVAAEFHRRLGDYQYAFAQQCGSIKREYQRAKRFDRFFQSQGWVVRNQGVM